MALWGASLTVNKTETFSAEEGQLNVRNAVLVRGKRAVVKFSHDGDHFMNLCSLNEHQPHAVLDLMTEESVIFKITGEGDPQVDIVGNTGMEDTLEDLMGDEDGSDDEMMTDSEPSDEEEASSPEPSPAKKPQQQQKGGEKKEEKKPQQSFGEQLNEMKKRKAEGQEKPQEAQQKQPEQKKVKTEQPKPATPAPAEKKAAEQPKKEQQKQAEQKKEEKKGEQQKKQEAKPAAEQKKQETPKKEETTTVGLKKTLPSGVKYEVKAAGQKDGKMATKGKKIAVKYEGRLTSGKKFDSGNLDFTCGVGEMIQGFDQGVLGMIVGERRSIFIPSHLGYGKRGAPPAVPGNADLIFDVTLAKVK